MAIVQEDNLFTHIIAIDFGTGASGYAITPRLLEGGSKRIEVFNPCDESDDQKTVTAILFNNSFEFVAFGSQALQRYAEIIDDEDTALLFQTYKIHLLHLHTNAISADGREMSLMKIISQTLKFISEKALQKLTEQVGKVIKTKIKWVLTVPALWNEEHKQFMRKACVEAEIVDNLNAHNLLLCLEPEGASMSVREDTDESVKEQMAKGSVVMVLDCGGGTVDITIHKLLCNPQEKFLCEELLPSSGGCEWGSKFVDVYFEEFLKELFGSELYNIYLKNAICRLEILKHFEMLKRKFCPGSEERSRLQLSYMGDSLSAKKLSELVKEYNQSHPPEFELKLRGSSSLDLPAILMCSFFQPLFENIKSKVAQLISQIKAKSEDLKFIFMVGGFSESPYLKMEIKKTFETNSLQILVPRRPQVCVVRGACLFGLDPHSISSRIAKKTYGINTLTTFDPEKHPENKKVIIEGEDFCEDVFDAFVRAGDSVGNEEVHTKTYCPVRSRQTVMRIIFYCTDSRDVDFIDEENVEQLGELTIDIGRPFQSVEDKTVKVTLRFGSTHIYACATNRDGTEIRNCEFKFDLA
jgi:molecular chaperone DnaK (HSP70)